MAREGRDEKGNLPVYELKIDPDNSNFAINLVPVDELPANYPCMWIELNKEDGKEER